MSELVTGIPNFIGSTGIANLVNHFSTNWGVLVMITIACVLLYLAIVKKFEPLLLLPIAFGMLLANLPLGNIMHKEYFSDPSGAINFR